MTPSNMESTKIDESDCLFCALVEKAVEKDVERRVCKGCALTPYFQTPSQIEAGKNLLRRFTKENLLKKILEMEEIHLKQKRPDLAKKSIPRWISYKGRCIRQNVAEEMSRKFSNGDELVKTVLPIYGSKLAAEDWDSLKSLLATLTETLEGLQFEDKAPEDDLSSKDVAALKDLLTPLVENFNMSAMSPEAANEVQEMINTAVTDALHKKVPVLRDFVISLIRSQDADVDCASSSHGK